MDLIPLGYSDIRDIRDSPTVPIISQYFRRRKEGMEFDIKRGLHGYDDAVF